MIDRRAQDDTARLARAVLEHQLEVIREAFIRRGKSEWIANDIIQTTIKPKRKRPMTTLRSAMADELDEQAQKFMSRHHDVTYLQAIRAILPEENHMSKYTTAAAATEVDARARRYLSEHSGSTYKEALGVVLKSDKQLAEAYSAPASRRVRMAAPADARSQPAVPIAPAEESEIADWITRAVRDGKAGSLPGALGQLSIEADKFAKTGMPVEEAVRRSMDTHPHLAALARLLLTDIRRNEKPEAQGNSAGYAVHVRAEALLQKHPHMDYREAVGAALSEDPVLKQRYAGMQR
jgi:hypothetical protein